MKRKVEVFKAGCPLCEDTVALVQSLACPSCEVTVYDLRAGYATNVCRERAKEFGVTSVPTVVIGGRILDCCMRTGVSAGALRAAGIGQAL